MMISDGLIGTGKKKLSVEGTRHVNVEIKLANNISYTLSPRRLWPEVLFSDSFGWIGSMIVLEVPCRELDGVGLIIVSAMLTEPAQGPTLPASQIAVDGKLFGSWLIPEPGRYSSWFP
jgi:hypothetical protein